MERSTINFQSYLLEVIGGPGRAGLVPNVLRGALGGLANVYDAGLEAYLFAEQVGLRKRERLPVPVISIGNLTVGGTGKTPMTQLLCRRLAAEGKRVAVLSRGHGGVSQSVRVVSDVSRVRLTAGEAGDEPNLLAQTLPGVPVLVGKDRRLSGREALRLFNLDALVLDDGFQYWQLRRDLDIVLLDSRRPFGNGFPLPRGLLREPMRHLRRAQVVVVTRAVGLAEAEREALTAQVGLLAPDARLFFADHKPVGLVPADALSALLLPLSMLVGVRIAAVSAIAQPQSFVGMLTHGLKTNVVYEKAWADHQALTGAEVRSVMNEAMGAGAEALVITEKDAVKWPYSADNRLPVYALRVEMAVEDEAGLLREIRAVCFK